VSWEGKKEWTGVDQGKERTVCVLPKAKDEATCEKKGGGGASTKLGYHKADLEPE